MKIASKTHPTGDIEAPVVVTTTPDQEMIEIST
jgi:hypothetical protein